MNEDILRAFAQLFAIISKQDEGITSSEYAFVSSFYVEQLGPEKSTPYLELYNELVHASYKQQNANHYTQYKTEAGTVLAKRATATESVQTLKISREIGKQLTARQKLIVITRLLEFISGGSRELVQKRHIVDTVSEIFCIEQKVYLKLKAFIGIQANADFDKTEYLCAGCDWQRSENEDFRHIYFPYLQGSIQFFNLPEYELLFARYSGETTLKLNDRVMLPLKVYVFSKGSKITTPSGKSLYYSELVDRLGAKVTANKIVFNARNISYKFSNGNTGLHPFNISEQGGKLIAVMGGSGSGKTTLINLLAGVMTPSEGSITINGVDLHRDEQLAKTYIGYVPQDDVLIDELSVLENLYYSARLYYGGLTKNEIYRLARKTLLSLQLWEIRHLKVGDFFNKQISGGQRKRLNIALELIREPSVLFLDEPTSGLSSKDSELVIDLLKELSLKGKLIFTVIHQPSDRVFNTFDKVILLDKGGYPIYYGAPEDTLPYLSRSQDNLTEKGSYASTSSTDSTSDIFNIIEAQVSDEYGETTNERRITPERWYQYFLNHHKVKFFAEGAPNIDQVVQRAPVWKQAWIYMLRDVKRKLSNTQYLLINLLEAPMLALLLSLIIRHKGMTQTDYLLRYNDNLPAYLLITIITALFMGLSLSAEEVIRDRKNLFREARLNISKDAYLFSKVLLMFGISALQTFLFVWIGNNVLEIKMLTEYYWLMVFSVACFANTLGLNISYVFNSPVTVYITIPILLIPQLILSGGIFEFDKLNNVLTEKEKVPMVADAVVSRWAFEGLAVLQYQENAYQKNLFWAEQAVSESFHIFTYWLPMLKQKADFCAFAAGSTDPDVKMRVAQDFATIQKTFNHPLLVDFMPTSLTGDILLDLPKYQTALSSLNAFHENRFDQATQLKGRILNAMEVQTGLFGLSSFKDAHFNEKLADMVKRTNITEKVSVFENMILQHAEPIYKMPIPIDGIGQYRSHFFAPVKLAFGMQWPTFYFNMAVIWLQTILLLILLRLQAHDIVSQMIRRFKFLTKEIKFRAAPLKC
jgi:ABC-type multidrug transport system ATPase subunit